MLLARRFQVPQDSVSSPPLVTHAYRPTNKRVLEFLTFTEGSLLRSHPSLSSPFGHTLQDLATQHPFSSPPTLCRAHSTEAFSPHSVGQSRQLPVDVHIAMAIGKSFSHGCPLLETVRLFGDPTFSLCRITGLISVIFFGHRTSHLSPLMCLGELSPHLMSLMGGQVA